MTTTPTPLRRADVDRLVDEHFAAEVRRDLETLLSTFADDVEHDVVGGPTVSHGKSDVEAYYRGLFADLHFERIDNVRRYHGKGFVVDESIVHAIATGRPLGIDGRNRPVEFRLLHVFEIAGGEIHRENAWLDLAAVFAQLNPAS
jgi:ketosteroid isomerase-like protein